MTLYIIIPQLKNDPRIKVALICSQKFQNSFFILDPVSRARTWPMAHHLASVPRIRCASPGFGGQEPLELAKRLPNVFLPMNGIALAPPASVHRRKATEEPSEPDPHWVNQDVAGNRWNGCATRNQFGMAVGEMSHASPPKNTWST